MILDEAGSAFLTLFSIIQLLLLHSKVFLSCQSPLSPLLTNSRKGIFGLDITTTPKADHTQNASLKVLPVLPESKSCML